MDITDIRATELERTTQLIKIVHYACESWYSVKDRPVAISCVCILDYLLKRSFTFSLTDTRDDPEMHLLKRYFEYLRSYPDAKYVHWNMNSSSYGFQAIANRYRYLTKSEPPYSPPTDKLYDLDDLIASQYGGDYADHPKLKSLLGMNGFNMRYFLGGKDEADKYVNNDHGDIRRSTEEKVYAIAHLLRKYLNGSLCTKSSGPYVPFAKARIDSVQIVLCVAGRMLDVSRQLARRHDNRATLIINDEYDVQDLFHSMLRMFFEDIRAEEWVPSYAGSASRVDFVLPENKIAIELKHARAGMTGRALGEQLIVDIEKYAKHQDVRHLVCLVFDKDGIIPNPRGLERDLSRMHNSLLATVRIVDK